MISQNRIVRIRKRYFSDFTSNGSLENRFSSRLIDRRLIDRRLIDSFWKVVTEIKAVFCIWFFEYIP